MASLKDIRTRIDSVKTTRQVTSAMKMVSAAKLKKAQDDIVKIRPYAEKLNDIIYDIISSLEEGHQLKLTEERDLEKVLIVMITSNRGLCGAFNSNVSKEVNKLLNTDFSDLHQQSKVDVMSIGKQGEKLLKTAGTLCAISNNAVYSDIAFHNVELISDQIILDFLNKKYDKVILVYNEFVNAAVQNVSAKQFLPIELPKIDVNQTSDYIYEPSMSAVLEDIVPKSLKTMFFSSILESIASEHGARMTSMHKATDNASELISDLELSYNKARQGAITNEILEIVGGAEALSQ
ncbi:ATP synthase F1 subunit gamma [Saccharicrinis aurantiacus]|uniref:ATP synthase F1 subunit gamma n=1 Tax=Saccharicrinis aurantiacus TaxID=1849719 RepID=UPI002493B26E|nr:ATP synthase F1 subunit gamma [Saccharicrinis aurantiacus]